ncbi:Uncharacterized protein BP5553_02055 [Venustampulla echinocandica]|uniref:Kelch motif n=1 Tax=Venustampulla echinocandica TaxID=2656787 RepID=A0A370U2R4_9HELO|nr:Uncharacterized protein BP5553_02055 [Venustampulla echinocandica]RDL42076.1 Uncharacterized protein BP5553_02055 [Venustampulla echinocandica]
MTTFTHEPTRGRTGVPSFSSQKSSDQLHECNRNPPTSAPKSVKTQRRSLFREEGLDDLDNTIHPSSRSFTKTSTWAAGIDNARDTNSQADKSIDIGGKKQCPKSSSSDDGYERYSRVVKPTQTVNSAAAMPASSLATIPRAALVVILIALFVPTFRSKIGVEVNINGADAGVIRTAELVENGSSIEGRANSPANVCTRWAHQAASVNGTVYIYGGNAKLKSGQTSDTWNNNLLTLDLTKSWKISSPSISGLPQPSGPPAVAMGFLWNSYESLWLYGGYFSDDPITSPLRMSTWEYNIKSSKWIDHADPTTSAGNHSEGNSQPVQRAAEGAGLSVPELGRSWFFGGYLDMYTTQGWSNQVARVYLKSLLEFTHPGYANTGVSSLGSTHAAGSDGAYRNITQGGLQEEAGFTERADGVLVYVPGWGDQGILLGLAGGTNETFTEMNIIDVYDIANSTWYKQSTHGKSPPIRVNPCAVVAAASDGSSFNIYLYGGQNLIPFGSQIQYSDMWILTIPSFMWIQVDLEGQSQPPARAGHTCTMRDGQMVVVGGYVGKDISCDSPGVYVFNCSSLEWTDGFMALAYSPESPSSPSGLGSASSDKQDSFIYRGSYGYQVPAPVQSIIGGSSFGGATASTPAAGSATAGPIATGRPPTLTITQSGSTIIQTAGPTSTASSISSNTPSPHSSSSANVGTVVAGVIAAALAILAGYLAFCAWLYRKQLNIYKNHVSIAQRRSLSPIGWGAGRLGEKAPGPGVMLGPFGTEIGGSGSTGRPSSSCHGIGSTPSTDHTTSQNYTSRPESIQPSHARTVPMPTYIGHGYGRLGEEQDDHLDPATAGSYGDYGRNSRSTAHSSMEDLLGGQEPSFFNVVWNPRRTLRVVNSD